MQGLADGYFILPVTIGDYLATQMGKKVARDCDPPAPAIIDARARDLREESRQHGFEMLPVLRTARLAERTAPSEQQAPPVVEPEVEQQLARIGRDLSERQNGFTDVVGQRLGRDLIGIRRDDGAPQARP